METLLLSVSAGNGPEECARAASLTLEAIREEAKNLRGGDITLRIIETEPSSVKGNIRSAIIALEGENVRPFAETWLGIIQWIRRSDYRPHHKRKNWFVSVKLCGEPSAGETVFPFSPADVRFETARSGGPGGQYVNKTETAVRAVHIPTGKAQVARGERSQLLNKKLALARLEDLFRREETEKEGESRFRLRHSHWELERGNPVRVYDGESLKLLRNNFIRKGINQDA